MMKFNFAQFYNKIIFCGLKQCTHKVLNVCAKVTDPMFGKNFIPMIKYACYLVEHKTYVFQAGLRTKAPIWNLIVHDMGKFNPRQWRAYARKYYNPHPYAKEPWAIKAHQVAEARHKHGNLHHIAHPKWKTSTPAIGTEDKFMRRMKPPYLREALADVAAVYKHKYGKFPFDSKLDAAELEKFFGMNLYHRMLPDNQSLFLQIYEEAVKGKNKSTFYHFFVAAKENLHFNRNLWS